MRINDLEAKKRYLEYFGKKTTLEEVEKLWDEVSELISIMRSLDWDNCQRIDMIEFLSNAHNKLNELLENPVLRVLTPEYYGKYQRNTDWCLNVDTSVSVKIETMQEYQKCYWDWLERENSVNEYEKSSLFVKILTYPIKIEIKKSEGFYKECKRKTEEYYLKYIQYEKSFWDNMVNILSQCERSFLDNKVNILSNILQESELT